jgi:hypothetical protein
LEMSRTMGELFCPERFSAGVCQESKQSPCQTQANYGSSFVGMGTCNMWETWSETAPSR